MRQYFSIFLFSILFLIPVCLHSQNQELRNPFDFPILLSGNFGELRSNHFHAGIDFKTQGVEGKPVHAVQDGYVSRISVSPWGYGNALYLTHPDGTTTVYGHLQKFNDHIAAYVREQQYLLESFSVNLLPESDLFPVKRGDIIALGGNSGSSAGPHLHFEIRDTESEELLDPIEYFKDRISDKRPPQIQGIMIYAFDGRGIANGKSGKQEIKLGPSKGNSKIITEKISAWGDIGFAVKSYDYMDNTSNIYGVKEIRLTVDSQLIYHSNIDRFAIHESRYLNSFTDYEEWKNKRSFYMKSFVEPGNRLRFIESQNRGIITINEERTYHISYHLEDAYGNIADLSFNVEGKEQDIPSPKTENKELFYWRSDNKFGAKGIRLDIPKNNLYDNLYFNYSVKEDTTALAGTHRIHDTPVAFHGSARLSLRLQIDTLDNKKSYGIVRLQNGRPTWIGGEYQEGWIHADIRETGNYSIRQDITPPIITPVNKEKWMSTCIISFKITDNLSGVKTYRGEIDGEYVLFELDGKKGLLTYTLDKERIQRGTHSLRLLVTDACGHISEYKDSFQW